MIDLIINIPKAIESGLPYVKTNFETIDGRSGVSVKVTYTDETTVHLASFEIFISSVNKTVLVHKLKVGDGMTEVFQSIVPGIVSRLEDVSVKTNYPLTVDLGKFEIDIDGTLKLYIWRNVLVDYTPGVIFAMAYTLAQARKVILDGAEDWDRKSVSFAVMESEPEVHESPYGFYISGGG